MMPSENSRRQRFVEASIYMMIGASIVLLIVMIARECPNAAF